MTPDLQPLRDSTPLLGDDDALRGRFGEDGYLFFRGLLTRGDLAPLQALVRAACVELGFCAGDGRPLVTTPDYADPRYVKLQQRAYPSPEMDHIRRHPALLAVLDALVDGPLGMGRGDIVRVRAPGGETRPHQDRHYLPGDDDLIAAWFPLEPCPTEHGTFAVIPGSHRAGLLPHDADRSSERGLLEPLGGPWHSADLKPGDAVLFGDHTVHRGLPTRAEVLRLSVDFRYSRGGGVPVGRFRP